MRCLVFEAFINVEILSTGRLFFLQAEELGGLAQSCDVEAMRSWWRLANISTWLAAQQVHSMIIAKDCENAGCAG